MNVHRSFTSQMTQLFPGVTANPGRTVNFPNITGLASNMEDFHTLINRALAYANALLQNGYEIININLVSGRNVNTEYTPFVGSTTTGEIIFREYRSSGGSPRLPVHAKWWKVPATSNMDTIGNQKIAFRNTPGMVIIDESSTSFTSLYDKLGAKAMGMAFDSIFGNPRRSVGTVTQDAVFSVLWYCNRADTSRKSLCKSTQ